MSNAKLIDNPSGCIDEFLRDGRSCIECYFSHVRDCEWTGTEACWNAQCVLFKPNTTATEELRRMLTERGVEYVLDEEYGIKYPPEQRITWSCDIAGEDMTVTARDYCIGINDDGSGEYCLDLEFHEVFTPTQAVEATLGRGTCEYCKDGKFDGQTVMISNHGWQRINFCPNCGRKVVSE